MPGRRLKCWLEEAILERDLNCNLPNLIYMKGNEDKGELPKMKVRIISKLFKDVNFEDDLSIEDN